MIEKLVGHMHWANSVVIDWMKDGRKNPDELLRLFSHILNVEKVWICRAMQIEDDRNTFKIHPVGAMSALNDSNHDGFKSLLLTDVKKAAGYRMFDGTPATSTIEDMVIHAFSHGFHHVGQMAALAAGSGEKFPGVSYLAYSRKT